MKDFSSALALISRLLSEVLHLFLEELQIVD
jgi:hypothetical protein